jgi:hypothetical protein
MKQLMLGALLIGVLGLGLSAYNPGTGPSPVTAASPGRGATTESVAYKALFSSLEAMSVKAAAARRGRRLPVLPRVAQA